MGVVLLGETIVTVGTGAVLGLLETAQNVGLEGVALRVILEDFEQFAHLVHFAEVAALHAEAAHSLAQFPEFFIFGFVMYAVSAWEACVLYGSGDLLVGTEHEFFDKLVALVVCRFFDAVGVAFFVDVDFDLGHVEVEGAFAKALLAQLAGDVPELADVGLQEPHLLGADFAERAAGGACLVPGGQGGLAYFVKLVLAHEGVGLLVGEAFVAADYGVGKLDLLDRGIVGEGDENALGEAVLCFDEAAQAVGKSLWQHRDDGADQVGAVATLPGLLVEGGAGLDVGGYVGDVNADAQTARVEIFEGEGIVEVLCVVGIDGKSKNAATVLAALALGFADMVGDLAGLLDDAGREVGVEFVFVEDGFELGVGLVCLAEHVDDFAFGVEVALLPVEEIDDDFVANFGDGLDAGFFRSRHQKVLNDAGIVGDDKPSVTAFFEIADDAGAGAFEDANDAHLGLFVRVAEGAAIAPCAAAGVKFEALVDAGQYMVAVHGDAGVFGGHGVALHAFFAFFTVRDENCGTALAEHDAATDEISFSGDAQSVLLNVGDFAGFQQV